MDKKCKGKINIYLLLFFIINNYNQNNANIIFSILDIIKKQFNAFKRDIKNKYMIITTSVILFDFFMIFLIWNL